ncbi:MAG: hypothetical protein ACTSUL_00880, partial [Promethearchaeota archaeon]
MTLYWAPLLHFYQPPTQEMSVLKKINDECYDPFLKMLKQLEIGKFSLNINGVLTESLVEHFPKTIELLKDLLSENKIEILGTGMYHPIL